MVTADFLDNGVVLHYHLGKPYGVPDEDEDITMSYEEVLALSPFQEEEFDRTRRFSGGTRWCEEVEIPQLNRTVVLVFDSYQERSAGPNEENFIGIFLKPQKTTQAA